MTMASLIESYRRTSSASLNPRDTMSFLRTPRCVATIVLMSICTFGMACQSDNAEDAADAEVSSDGGSSADADDADVHAQPDADAAQESTLCDPLPLPDECATPGAPRVESPPCPPTLPEPGESCQQEELLCGYCSAPEDSDCEFADPTSVCEAHCTNGVWDVYETICTVD